MSARARILSTLKPHNAANPMDAGDLLATVGGCEAAAWAAVEELVAEHQVMTCHIHRPGGSVVVFWPMGKLVNARPGRKAGRK